MNYVGLDIHKAFCQATVLAEDGSVVKSGRFDTTEADICKFFSGIIEAEVVIEAI